MSKVTRSAYTHIVVHAINEDKCHEVWASYTETHSQLGQFDSDGVIGWIYPLCNGYGWLNEAGHITQIFHERDDLIGYLQSLAPSMEWVK